MQLIQTFANSLHNRLPLFLSQFAFHLEDVVQLSPYTILQKKVEVELILEEGIEFNEIYMIKEGLQLDLSNELL
jgi:hypothetical protein